MAIREVNALGKTYKISYEIKNPKFDDYILILHGWGASKEIMIKSFGDKFDGFKLIFVDLPGMGGSEIFTPLNSEKYAKILESFIKTFNKKPSIIMGHSFGGKVATLLRPPFLVLLSSAGIVEGKPFMVKLKIRVFKIFKALGFGNLYKIFATKDASGMSRVMYETLKNVVNEDFRDTFARCVSRTLIFWGKGDKAVSLESGELISRLINGSKFYPLDGDHFFFLLHAKFIAEEIVKNYNKSQTIKDSDSIELSEFGVSEVYEREKKPLNEPVVEEISFDEESIELDLGEVSIVKNSKNQDEEETKDLDQNSTEISSKNLNDTAIEPEISSEIVKTEPEIFDETLSNLDTFEFRISEVYERDYAKKDDETKEISDKNNTKKDEILEKDSSPKISEEIKSVAKENHNEILPKKAEIPPKNLETKEDIVVNDEENSIKNLAQAKKSEKSLKLSEIYKKRLQKIAENSEKMDEK